MRSAPPAAGVLPPSLAAPRISALQWLALAAGVGCAVCAYAGLYPRFDEGALRLVLAATCAPFAAAVVAAALRSPTASGAFGRAVALAALLGVASTIIPAAILTRDHRNEFIGVCVLGVLLGAPTGAVYGIPLGVLCALGHRHVRAATHEGTDRAARVSGIWLFVIGLVGVAGAALLDNGGTDSWTDTFVPASPLPPAVACLAAAAGLYVVARAVRRLDRRALWLDRVRSGREPAFRLRAAQPHDPVDGLPRLSNGTTVVEWCAADVSAYRMPAAGLAVAIVDERPFIA